MWVEGRTSIIPTVGGSLGEAGHLEVVLPTDDSKSILKTKPTSPPDPPPDPPPSQTQRTAPTTPL